MNNKLIFTYSDEIGIIYSDISKIKQSLLNVLSNACKFTKNGTITLECTLKDINNASHILFTVSDDGCGIAEKSQKRLFSAFMQADSSTTKKYGGTGLGLLISKKFCEIMGGDITLNSTENVGTTFVISIPLVLSDTACYGTL